MSFFNRFEALPKKENKKEKSTKKKSKIGRWAALAAAVGGGIGLLNHAEKADKMAAKQFGAEARNPKKTEVVAKKPKMREVFKAEMPTGKIETKEDSSGSGNPPEKEPSKMTEDEYFGLWENRVAEMSNADLIENFVAPKIGFEDQELIEKNGWNYDWFVKFVSDKTLENLRGRVKTDASLMMELEKYLNNLSTEHGPKAKKIELLRKILAMKEDVARVDM
ncbi:MAG: hypothetical protein PHT40_04210 [Patescibacteria group bacterium]|nr:hypothetical protein [Patescibacteria group bacterium]